jgi:hypothetical protein
MSGLGLGLPSRSDSHFGDAEAVFLRGSSLAESRGSTALFARSTLTSKKNIIP